MTNCSISRASEGTTLKLSLRDLILVKLDETWQCYSLVHALTAYQIWNLQNSFNWHNPIFEVGTLKRSLNRFQSIMDLSLIEIFRLFLTEWREYVRFRDSVQTSVQVAVQVLQPALGLLPTGADVRPANWARPIRATPASRRQFQNVTDADRSGRWCSVWRRFSVKISAPIPAPSVSAPPATHRWSTQWR